MLEVVVATSNLHKVSELRALLPVAGIRWRSLTEFPRARAPRETGRSFHANAVLKARAAARATGRIALADDSGLEVAALGGAPGIRSARFAGRHGDGAANNAKLLRLLRRRRGASRRARYRCVLALAAPQRVLAVVTGAWEGRIAQQAVGRGGFGYDPVFVVPGRQGKTVAQLPPRLKQRLSHRAAAARRLRSFHVCLTRGLTPNGVRPLTSRRRAY